MFLQKPNAIGSGTQVIAGQTSYFERLQQVNREVEELSMVFEAKSVAISGTDYRLGAVISTGFSNDLPDFALINKIVVLSQNCMYFLIEKLITVLYSPHFTAYEIRRVEPSVGFCLSKRISNLPAIPHSTTIWSGRK